MAHEDIHEPSVVTALGRAIDAGQRIIVNRIDLARLDILEMVSRAARGGVIMIAGAVLLGVGWLAFSSAAIIFGQHYVSLSGSAAIVGALNVAIGLVLVSIGIDRTRPGVTTSDNGNGSAST